MSARLLAVTNAFTREVAHVLKTWPDVFDLVWDGHKTHEFRKNDRGFKRGELALLREFDPTSDTYSGREVLVEITAISYGPEWGIPEGFAAFSIRKIPFLRLVSTGRS